MGDELLSIEPEFVAIQNVYAALSPLEAEAQLRVIQYVSAKLKLPSSSGKFVDKPVTELDFEASPLSNRNEQPSLETDERMQDDLEGISPAGRKWITRNGLKASELSSIFSLGIDEIDLVAQKVPGNGKKERMHNVYLLKGVAAYLGTGVATFTQAQVKEALIHYDAFDTNNNATYFASLASEVSGSKETGFTLTSRGLTNATVLLKEMTGAKPK